MTTLIKDNKANMRFKIIRKRYVFNPVLHIPWVPCSYNRHLHNIEQFPWNLNMEGGVATDLTTDQRPKTHPLYRIFKIAKKPNIQMCLEEMYRNYPTISRSHLNAALLLSNNNLEAAKVLLELQARLERQNRNRNCNDGKDEEPLNLSANYSTRGGEQTRFSRKIKIVSNTVISSATSPPSVQAYTSGFINDTNTLVTSLSGLHLPQQLNTSNDHPVNLSSHVVDISTDKKAVTGLSGLHLPQQINTANDHPVNLSSHVVDISTDKKAVTSLSGLHLPQQINTANDHPENLSSHVVDINTNQEAVTSLSGLYLAQQSNSPNGVLSSLVVDTNTNQEAVTSLSGIHLTKESNAPNGVLSSHFVGTNTNQKAVTNPSGLNLAQQSNTSNRNKKNISSGVGNRRTARKALPDLSSKKITRQSNKANINELAMLSNLRVFEDLTNEESKQSLNVAQANIIPQTNAHNTLGNNSEIEITATSANTNSQQNYTASHQLRNYRKDNKTVPNKNELFSNIKGHNSSPPDPQVLQIPTNNKTTYEDSNVYSTSRALTPIQNEITGPRLISNNKITDGVNYKNIEIQTNTFNYNRPFIIYEDVIPFISPAVLLKLHGDGIDVRQNILNKIANYNYLYDYHNRLSTNKTYAQNVLNNINSTIGKKVVVKKVTGPENVAHNDPFADAELMKYFAAMQNTYGTNPSNYMNEYLKAQIIRTIAEQVLRESWAASQVKDADKFNKTFANLPEQASPLFNENQIMQTQRYVDDVSKNLPYTPINPSYMTINQSLVPRNPNLPNYGPQNIPADLIPRYSNFFVRPNVPLQANPYLNEPQANLYNNGQIVYGSPCIPIVPNFTGVFGQYTNVNLPLNNNSINLSSKSNLKKPRNITSRSVNLSGRNPDTYLNNISGDQQRVNPFSVIFSGAERIYYEAGHNNINLALQYNNQITPDMPNTNYVNSLGRQNAAPGNLYNTQVQCSQCPPISNIRTYSGVQENLMPVMPYLPPYEEAIKNSTLFNSVNFPNNNARHNRTDLYRTASVFEERLPVRALNPPPYPLSRDSNEQVMLIPERRDGDITSRVSIVTNTDKENISTPYTSEARVWSVNSDILNLKPDSISSTTTGSRTSPHGDDVQCKPTSIRLTKELRLQKPYISKTDDSSLPDLVQQYYSPINTINNNWNEVPTPTNQSIESSKASLPGDQGNVSNSYPIDFPNTMNISTATENDKKNKIATSKRSRETDDMSDCDDNSKKIKIPPVSAKGDETNPMVVNDNVQSFNQSIFRSPPSLRLPDELHDNSSNTSTAADLSLRELAHHVCESNVSDNKVKNNSTVVSSLVNQNVTSSQIQDNHKYISKSHLKNCEGMNRDSVVSSDAETDTKIHAAPSNDSQEDMAMLPCRENFKIKNGLPVDDSIEETNSLKDAINKARSSLLVLLNDFERFVLLLNNIAEKYLQHNLVPPTTSTSSKSPQNILDITSRSSPPVLPNAASCSKSPENILDIISRSSPPVLPNAASSSKSPENILDIISRSSTPVLPNAASSSKSPENTLDIISRSSPPVLPNAASSSKSPENILEITSRSSPPVLPNAASSSKSPENILEITSRSSPPVLPNAASSSKSPENILEITSRSSPPVLPNAASSSKSPENILDIASRSSPTILPTELHHQRSDQSTKTVDHSLKNFAQHILDIASRSSPTMLPTELHHQRSDQSTKTVDHSLKNFAQQECNQQNSEIKVTGNCTLVFNSLDKNIMYLLSGSLQSIQCSPPTAPYKCISIQERDDELAKNVQSLKKGVIVTLSIDHDSQEWMEIIQNKYRENSTVPVNQNSGELQNNIQKIDNQLVELSNVSRRDVTVRNISGNCSLDNIKGTKPIARPNYVEEKSIHNTQLKTSQPVDSIKRIGNNASSFQQQNINNADILKTIGKGTSSNSDSAKPESFASSNSAQSEHFIMDCSRNQTLSSSNPAPKESSRNYISFFSDSAILERNETMSSSVPAIPVRSRNQSTSNSEPDITDSSKIKSLSSPNRTIDQSSTVSISNSAVSERSRNEPWPNSVPAIAERSDPARTESYRYEASRNVSSVPAIPRGSKTSFSSDPAIIERSREESMFSSVSDFSNSGSRSENGVRSSESNKRQRLTLQPSDSSGRSNDVFPNKPDMDNDIPHSKHIKMLIMKKNKKYISKLL